MIAAELLLLFSAGVAMLVTLVSFGRVSRNSNHEHARVLLFFVSPFVIGDSL
jgi:hypothetical protein